MTLLLDDPIFLRHETGTHPETPDRLRAIDAQLDASQLRARCQTATFQPLTDAQLAQVHSESQVQLARQTSLEGGGYLDPDTVLSEQSFDVARLAAGAAVAAVDHVLAGRDSNALCLIRPPGHHATPTQSMGFCLFNNVALAAHHAKTVHGLNRILIVDWDVHHGNGTQDIFYCDPSVFFLSIHRFGNGFYPGTGAADETGAGPGLGATLNLPVRYGTVRDEYLGLFTNALEKVADQVKPELVLLSAGFDAHARDPIGSLGLEVEDFVALTHRMLDVANGHAQGRLVSCLEGGYHLQALAHSVAAHLEVLLAGSKPAPAAHRIP